MKNLNSIVESVKLIARDELRMKHIAKVQTDIYDLEKNVNEVNEEIGGLKKAILREEYAISKVEDQNPDAAEIREAHKEKIEAFQKMIESRNNVMANLEKAMAEQKEKIQKIESGEIKVNLEKLNERTKVLIEEITKEAAVKEILEGAQ